MYHISVTYRQQYHLNWLNQALSLAYIGGKAS